MVSVSRFKLRVFGLARHPRSFETAAQTLRQHCNQPVPAFVRLADGGAFSFAVESHASAIKPFIKNSRSKHLVGNDDVTPLVDDDVTPLVDDGVMH